MLVGCHKTHPASLAELDLNAGLNDIGYLSLIMEQMPMSIYLFDIQYHPFGRGWLGQSIAGLP
jgi:hypothetical protein